MTREASNEGRRCEKCKRFHGPQHSHDPCPYCELKRLRAERQAAIDLLSSVDLVHGRSRIAWGYSPEHGIMGYFLDGVYAGQTYSDVLRAAITKDEMKSANA